VRLGVGDQDLVVGKDGSHRSDDNDRYLRRRAAINDASTVWRKREMAKRLRRKRRLPGMCW
jgi:hypothetical protein